MPIPVRVAVPRPEPEPQPQIPGPVPWSRSEIRWTPPRGQPLVLTGDITGDRSGIVVDQGVKGLDAPPFSLQMDEPPLLDGSIVRGVRASAREIMLPLVLWAPDRARFNTLRRDVLNAFNPKLGPGVLTVREHDGTSRSIACYYSGGLEGDYQDASGWIYSRYGLILQAPDPLFYGDTVTVRFDRTATPGRNFFDGRGGEVITPQPFLGPHLSADVPSGSDAQLDITGDEDTWPVWTVTGYRGAGLTLSSSSGSRVHLDYTSTEPVTIRIDTRPGRKWVYEGRLEGGDFIRQKNLWPHLKARDLWPIPSGLSRAEIEIHALPGAQPSGLVTLEYNPRYLGA